MLKVIFAGIFGLLLGLGAAFVVFTAYMPTPGSQITGAFIADTNMPEENVTVQSVQASDSLQLSEAFQSDIPIIDSAKCEKNPYPALRSQYTYICSLFYKTAIDIRKIEPTGSMWPNLKGGGFVILGEAENMTIGDIIIINETVYGREIVHRITEIGNDTEGTWYKTEGDNNAVPDNKLLHSENISFKVIGIIY